MDAHNNPEGQQNIEQDTTIDKSMISVDPSIDARKDRIIGSPSVSHIKELAASHALKPRQIFAEEEIIEEQVIRNKSFAQLIKPVIKIFTVSTEPNYSMPWQMKKQKRSTSSGFVISGKRIITNAHSISYQTSLMVRKHGDSKKYIAKLLEVGNECDLALLTVEDDLFWRGIEPVEFGGVPNLQDSVTVVGYPTGGENISVTKGVVSRVDITTYAHSSTKLLAIQIDAAINAGNSGGPAFQGDRLIGIAFETLQDAENIGYIIPIPILEHFLKDIEIHGHYTGFPDLGVSCQSMENQFLRNFMNMKPEQSGILVNKTEPLSDATKKLKRFDVILASDGTPIADDGTVEFRNEERISFRYLFMNKFVGDTARLGVLRDGQVMDIDVTLSPPDFLVPVNLYDQMPSYFTYAGFVFVPLTRPYLRHQWGKGWDKKAPIKICDKALNDFREDPEEEIVIISQVLAAEINVGYQSISNIQVLEVNGTKVKNLRHFASLVEATTSKFIRFDLEYARSIILDVQEALVSNDKILQQHSIAFTKSSDLRTPQSNNDNEAK